MFIKKLALLASAAFVLPAFTSAAYATCISTVEIVNKSSRTLTSGAIASQREGKRNWVARSRSANEYDYGLHVKPGETDRDKVDFGFRNDETPVKFRVKYRFLLKEGDKGYVAGKEKWSRVLLAESDVQKCDDKHTVVIQRESW